MIAPDHFVEHLQGLGVDMFVGVPDSLLKPFSQYVMDELPRTSHVITANEGAAVGYAMGHYLGSGNPALVYLQNSGLGNTINPLLSLADREVYGVPMIVLVGWRGQPGVSDEPQHVKQGRVMLAMLDAMELPYSILPTDAAAADEAMATAVEVANRDTTPYVVAIEKGTFESLAGGSTYGLPGAEQLPTREDALDALTPLVPPDATIVSTTGMLSRELFELRVARGESGARDFLTVGGMGHASAIALGLSRSGCSGSETWCLDGDGAVLMHTGTLATIADHGGPNLMHVVMNNGVHDSVGGQPTSITTIDLPAVALASGYRWSGSISSLHDATAAVGQMRGADGPSLLEVRVRPGARPDLGRPTRTPRESLEGFIDAVRAS